MVDGKIKLPDDTNMLGPKVRTVTQVIGPDTVHSDVVAVQNTAGTIIDPLTPTDLDIETSSKLLNVQESLNILMRLFTGSPLGHLMIDSAGRLLVRIDVAGVATPVTVASTTLSTNPYTAYDHERQLSDLAFQNQRMRFEFS